jgi:hypothetical protein
MLCHCCKHNRGRERGKLEKIEKKKGNEKREKERKGEKKIISLSLLCISCPSGQLLQFDTPMSCQQRERVSFENTGYYEIEFFVSNSHSRVLLLC